MVREKAEASAYDEDYFRRFYDPVQGIPYERGEPWLSFFGSIADRIVRDIAPRTVLDAGCAMGLLVEALRDRGVEAYGIDISEFAISQVREDMREYCQLGSITEPLPRRYDLIVTIETLEHVTAAQGEAAIDNFCAHADDVIFSSTPIHFREPTHLNVQPPEYWTELFARNGLFRDVPYDATIFVSPWAVRYRRTSDSVARVVASYERLAWRQKHEISEVRGSMGESRQELARQIAAAEDADRRAAAAEARARDLEDRITALESSAAYRIATAPVRLARFVLPRGTRRGSAARWLGRRRRGAPG